MKKIVYIFTPLVCCLLAIACNQPANTPVLRSQDVIKVISQMTDLMVHDVTNPPLASRFFAYTCLAGYEVTAQNDKHVKSMHGRLNDYPAIGKPKIANNYDYRLSAVIAMYKTAEKLQPSGVLLAKSEQAFLDSCRKIGFTNAVIDSSVSYGQAISKQVLRYAKADKYNRISNYRRYEPTGKPGSWDPTPPSYMMAVEPYFNTVRPFTLSSASQFAAAAPIPFSVDKKSAFYKYLQLSYAKSGKGLTVEEKNIANFWDCNPFAVQNEGHMVLGLKKISPGAHWMGIAGLACNQSNASFSKTIAVTTAVSIGLMDSFICCWDDKYHTNRIRPETAIRKYIDPEWQPLLQTPPFPEYISGHSVVSTTSAVILTHYLGDNFHYTDSIEVSFGVPPRKFTSFKQAANEAAISRFWGGIHFMDAIDNGVIQGTKVGNWVLQKL